MFRSISKLSRIISLHRRPMIVCSYAKQIQDHEKRPNLFDHTLKYLHENPKCKTFDLLDQKLYEFDAESRALTASNILKNAKSIPWTDFPVECNNIDLILTLKNVRDFCLETNTSFSSEQFDSFVDEMAKRLPQFTSNETICALQIFARIPTDGHKRPNEMRNVAEIFIGLDQACTINANEWDIDQVLYAGSIWCTIRMAKKTFYARYLGRHFEKYAKLMTLDQLVQAMCYLDTMKRPIDDIRKFENVFDENIEAMSPMELSIFCKNFMRFDTALAKPELRDKLLKFLLERDLNELNDMMLVYILHVTQKSVNGIHTDRIAALQKKLQKLMTKKALRTCILFADLGSFLHLTNTEIIEITLNRCMIEPNAFESFSINDLERLSRVIGMLNVTFESGIEIVVGKAILVEIRNRIEEFTKQSFHQHFIRIQKNLSMKDIYDIEMLENTLRKDYIRFMYFRSAQLVSDIYCLNTYACLNLAFIYQGNTLSDQQLLKMGKFLTDYIPGDEPKPRIHSTYVMNIADCVANLFKHFTYAHAISHFRCPDIFVAIDKTTDKAIDVKHLFPPSYTGQLISAQKIIADNSNLELYAFVAANFPNFDVKTGRLLGNIKQKLQQLELLGFHTVLIAQTEWKCVKDEERKDFVHRKFLEKLQKNRSIDELSAN